MATIHYTPTNAAECGTDMYNNPRHVRNVTVTIALPLSAEEVKQLRNRENAAAMSALRDEFAETMNLPAGLVLNVTASDKVTQYTGSNARAKEARQSAHLACSHGTAHKLVNAVDALMRDKLNRRAEFLADNDPAELMAALARQFGCTVAEMVERVSTPTDKPTD